MTPVLHCASRRGEGTELALASALRQSTHRGGCAMEEKKDVAVTRSRAARDRGIGEQMNVKSLMTAAPRTCTRGTNLAEAAALMLDADCGILPVVDEEGKLV